MGSEEVSTQRLLRTPRPEPDESLVGYVVRLTEANYYESVTWVANLAGLRVNFATGGWMTLNRDDVDLSLFEVITGNSCGSFESLRYKVDRYMRTVRFRGVELPTSAVKFRRPKVCPSCLRESNYCRKVWDLLPFTACPAHGIVLLDACPECGGRVSWVRSKVSCCRCGSDWRDALGVKTSPEALKASQRIGELCSDANMAKGGDKEPLYRLCLRSLCEALSVIADHYLRMTEGKRVTDDTENSACHDAFAYAFSALEEWPRGFEKFLNEYGLENTGGAPEFRPILELHKLCKARELDFMTVALEQFIEDESSKCGEVICEARAPFKRFVPLREIGRYFNIRPSYLEGLLRNGQIRTFRKEGDGGDEILIDLDSVAKFKEESASLLTSFDAARLLGVDIAGVDDLVWHGCLRPASGPSVDGLPDCRFDRAEPGRLLEKIGARVVATGMGSRERISGGDVLQLLRRHKIGVGHFVREVLYGSPAPRFTMKGGGLIQFGFSKREINEYIYALTGREISTKAKNTPNFRYLAHALEKRREQNERAFLSGSLRIDEAAGWGRININDLVRIAGVMLCHL